MKDAPAPGPELPFVEALKRGLADYDDVDDYIDRWHDGPYSCTIYEFLGMTKEQYFKWGEDESYLRRTFRKGSVPEDGG